MNDKMKKIYTTSLYGFAFVIFSLLIRVFDVQPAGPQGSKIGLAGLNTAVHQFFGEHIFWYELTQIFGYLALAVAAVFAVTGLVQLIKRHSLVKVDKKLLMLGIVYIVLITLYVLFEKIPFNYRPVILDPEQGLEPSYPSTHTLLILTIFGTAFSLVKDYIKNQKLLVIVKLFCLIIIALTIIGRLVCGVHWFTDIIGGVLLSIFLISLYKTLTYTPSEPSKEE